MPPEKNYVTEDRCSEHVKSLSAMMAGSMETINETLKGLHQAITDIDARLFRDNGRVSIQTQVRMNGLRVDRVEAVVNRALWLVLGGLVTTIGGLVIKMI